MKRTALITGGSRGIGLGIATALSNEGFDLAINGIRAEADVRETLAALRNDGREVIYCQGNIASKDDRDAILSSALRHFGKIDVLVNNAGMAPRVRRDVLETTEASYDELMEVNLKGPFFLSQAVANEMVKEKKNNPGYYPCIISITSVSAEIVSTNRAEYCLSKAGLAMMTKLFAGALADAGIPVYEVRPGLIDTDMTAPVKEKYDRLIANGLTLQKRWGTPEDIGRIVATLVRGDIPYATGQVIHADGGMQIRTL